MDPRRLEQLAARAGRGDLAALAGLYDALAPRLYRAARRLVDEPQDAEDAVQDVFLGLVRAGGRAGDIRDVTAYLFAALRRAAGRIRQARRRQPAPDTPAVQRAAADDRLPASPLGERLERALGRLPPEQREAVALKIDGELTFDQMGRVLGVSPNTAASRYRYALAKLRQWLEEGRQ